MPNIDTSIKILIFDVEQSLGEGVGGGGGVLQFIYKFDVFVMRRNSARHHQHVDFGSPS